MSDDHQENGTSNGDVPEIELIIKVTKFLNLKNSSVTTICVSWTRASSVCVCFVLCINSVFTKLVRYEKKKKKLICHINARACIEDIKRENITE